MNTDDRKFATAVLNRVCRGAHIDGVRFASFLQILISDDASGATPIRGQVYLNLASCWTCSIRCLHRCRKARTILWNSEMGSKSTSSTNFEETASWTSRWELMHHIS